MASRESYTSIINRKTAAKQRVMRVASGREKAELVLKNATYVNVFTNELDTADIACTDGVIAGIGSYEGELELDMTGKVVAPGLIDAHIHLESSLVAPAEFVKAVLPHGTTAVITDPHEIANVLGTDGIDYMIQATEGLPVEVRFMLPSCVPATPLDEAGARMDYQAIDAFYDYDRVQGLAEMMNYTGVIHGDAEVLQKIAAAHKYHCRIDGHAPGLSGNDLNAYIAAGVYSDHECSSMEEAMEKLRRGQYIMIREGTAARNLKALSGLLVPQYYEHCMFCSDDKHPSDLLEKGHIDAIIRQAVQEYGVDPIIAIKAATHHAARYFGLKSRGAIAPGYLADFVIFDDLKDFHVNRVLVHGETWYENGKMRSFEVPDIDEWLVEKVHHTFNVDPLKAENFEDHRPRGVIGMIPGEIVTTDAGYATGIDTDQDILKIAVVERHRHTGHIGIGYLKGYGLKEGAVATSISHDSHNIIVVGTSDEEMAAAANRIIENGGGITVVHQGKILGEVILNIAGLMSEESLPEVNKALEYTKDQAFCLGVSRGIDPFMTLSFMSLPVIPELRLTTRGIIDVSKQQYI
ncbi:MAG: adenine deaminase [Coprococcus sp.]